VTGMSRSTIIKILKKSSTTDCDNYRAFQRTANS
jgi:hypothetical protein